MGSQVLADVASPKLTFYLQPHEIPSNTLIFVFYVDIQVVLKGNEDLYQATYIIRADGETVKAFTFKWWTTSFLFFINFLPTDNTPPILWCLGFWSYTRKNIWCASNNISVRIKRSMIWIEFCTFEKKCLRQTRQYFEFWADHFFTNLIKVRTFTVVSWQFKKKK